MAAKGQFQVTDRQAQEMADQHASGLSFREIGRRWGLNHETVSDAVRRVTAAPAPPPRRAEDNPQRVLIIDIETRPALAYVWGVWNQNIRPEMIVEEKEIISFAAKWAGDDETLFYSVYHDTKLVMVQALQRLLSEAHAVVTWNGDRFDLRHISHVIAECGLFPPKPYKSVDLLKTCRAKFAFSSNKLDNVADKWLDDRKLEHEGFRLWPKCMAGDSEAWERMRAYNIHDVELTEQAYFKFLPWLEQHPSVSVMWRDEDHCIRCGSEESLRPDGHYYTKTRMYPLYQCGECGTWQRGTRHVGKTELTGVAG